MNNNESDLSGLIHSMDYFRDSIRPVKYKKGETIFKQNSPATFLGIVDEGFAKLSIDAGNEKFFIYKIATPGDIIGMNELFGDKFHHLSAITMCPLKISFIEIERFKSFMFKNSELHLKLIQWYCNEMNFIFKRSVEIATKQVHGRLADAIFYLNDLYKRNNLIYNYIARKDLAEFVGMSVKSLIRSLNELKNDKIIRMDGKNIIIENEELLKRLSRIG
jgi:CRP-like cAMP-binding protein